MSQENLGVAVGRVEINTSALKNADIALRSAGTSMLNLGTMAVGAFGAIVGEAAKFEKEMDFVQAVTAASGSEMDALKAKAIDLGKNSIYGPIALSQAFVELAKAGATADQIIEGVGEAAVQLATAADVPIPFAGENLINILNTFKLGAGDATTAADLLAGAANASSVELQDLVYSFKYAGPVAAGLGIKLEDVNDALTILGKVGIRGSTAGTSLRAIMLRLNEDSGPAAEALKDLGIVTEDGSNKFFDASGNAKSLAEIFGILGDATKDLNTQQKVAVLNNLFGQRAIPSALELLSQGEEGFKRINEEIKRTTAADVAAKRMDNLDGSIKRLKATLSALFVEAGGPFQKMLKGWVDGLRDALLFLDSLPGPVKTFIVGAVGVIGVLSILAGAFLLTIGNIVRMIRVLGEIRNAFLAMRTAAAGASAANTALSASILTSPIFWIVAAVIALAVAFYLLYTRVKGFRDFIDSLWQHIQKAWDGITKGFNDLYHDFLNILQGLIKWFQDFPQHVEDAAEAVANFFLALPGRVRGFLGDLAEAIGSFFADVWRNAKMYGKAILTEIGNAVGNAFLALTGFVTELPGRILGALGKVAGAIGGFLAELPAKLAYALGFAIGRIIRFQLQLGKAIIKGVAKLLRAYVEFLTKLPGMFYRTFSGVIQVVARWAASFVSWAFRAGADFVSALINWLIGLPGQVWDILVGIFNFMVTFVPMAVQKAIEIGQGIFNGILDFLIQLPSRVWGIFLGIVDFLGSLIPTFGQKALEIGTSVFNGIIDFFVDLPGRITGLLWDAVNAVGGFVSRFFQKAKDIGSSLWNGFKDGLFGSPHTKIEYAMWDMQDNMRKSLAAVRSNVRTLQGLEQRLPAMNSGVLGLSSPAVAAALNNGSGSVYQQNAPLIDKAVIRDERDAVTLARELAKEQARQQRARGRAS